MGRCVLLLRVEASRGVGVVGYVGFYIHDRVARIECALLGWLCVQTGVTVRKQARCHVLLGSDGDVTFRERYLVLGEIGSSGIALLVSWEITCWCWER
jgi:hypothetical protein